MRTNKQLLKELGITKRATHRHVSDLVSSNKYVIEYLAYWTYFITAARFAEHREISVKQAYKIINKGRVLRESEFSGITHLIKQD